MAEAQLAVGNIRPTQRANTRLVDIDYDVTGTNVPVSVSLQGSADGGATWTLTVNTLTGAIGTSVTPGNNLRITWNAGVDWNQQVSTRTKFRITVSALGSSPEGFALIPAGEFSMGDALDGDANAPVHSVTVNQFYMAKNLTTKAEWDVVRVWALSHGYSDLAGAGGKGANHPVQMVSWFEMVKFCNARSEQEGLTPCYRMGGAVMRAGTTEPTVNWGANGYRLPTEAEWEKAALGGLSGKRFPWGDTIAHSQANYYSDTIYSYDLSPTRGYHPTYAVGTSPVGAFPANGYGLRDMAGNVWQWCWDWYGTYGTGTSTDPRGAASGSGRVGRGGSWNNDAIYCLVAFRDYRGPPNAGSIVGFRVACSSVP